MPSKPGRFFRRIIKIFAIHDQKIIGDIHEFSTHVITTLAVISEEFSNALFICFAFLPGGFGRLFRKRRCSECRILWQVERRCGSGVVTQETPDCGDSQRDNTYFLEVGSCGGGCGGQGFVRCRNSLEGTAAGKRSRWADQCGAGFRRE